MEKKSAFISFDYDHDKDIRGSLVAQAEDHDSPFSIADWSLKEPVDEKWRAEVRDIVRRTDLTIFLCGEHTRDARGVSAEMTIVQREETVFPIEGATEAALPEAERRIEDRPDPSVGLEDSGQTHQRGEVIAGTRM